MPDIPKTAFDTAGDDATLEAQSAARLAWESARIEEARESVRLGRTISYEAFSAWIQSWDTPHELPKPRSGR